MKNLLKKFNNKTKYFLIIALSFVLITCSLFLLLPSETSFADENSPKSEYYLPQTPLEYKGLSTPVDVYYSNDLTAIAQKDTLFIYKDGGFIDTSSLSFTSLKQVKRLNDNTLLIIDNGIIYSIDIVSLTKTELRDTQNRQISGNYFDVNDNYVVTAFGTSALIYKINGNSFTKISPTYPVKNDLPIAINKNNQVFFVDSTGICKATVGTTSAKSTVYNANPNKMIADNEFIYYIENSDVIRLTISDSTKHDLDFSAIDDDYTLGSTINSPMGLSFKDKNLLITDASSAQEFKIENGELVFTGFAIANNRSAFNRIGKTASDVEKYGNTVAVLDEFKLTVFYNANEDYYSRENFNNFLSDDLGGEMPSSFALGRTSLILLYRQNTSSSTLKFLDIESRKISENAITVFNGNIMYDACYQSGYFYLLCSNGSSSSVYKFSENDFTYEIIAVSLSDGFTKISVDVFGNIYLVNDSYIYKYTKSNAYRGSSLINTSGVKKIASDLSGRLFVLNGDGLNYLNNGSLINVYKSTLTTATIESFALDFISDEVYFIYDDEELLSTATGLSNVAISSVVAPENYKTTGANATLTDLKIYSPKLGANVYFVNPENNKFTFNDLITEQSEYVYICDIPVNSALTLTALAGQQGVVLVNKTELTQKTISTTTAPNVAYVTTGVNAYFFPVITKNSEFSITDNNSVVRLNKSTMIIPEKTLNFLGREYYFASVTVDGTTHKCYVPTAFTVEVLDQNFEWQEYTLHNVKKCTVYANAELTETLTELSDGAQVRVIENEKGVAKIIVEKDGEISIGFIQSKMIKNPSGDAIKIVIVIMALGLCILGTGLYLIHRKKK